MPTTLHEPDAREVLSRYAPQGIEASWTALGNAGGFSGARIWRGILAQGEEVCLREWPMHRMTEDRLFLIHQALNALSPLTFVPQLYSTADDATWVQLDEDSFWELTSWRPGQADFHMRPSNVRLFAAMRALAATHECLKPLHTAMGPCPAVRRMLRAMRGWRELLQTGWSPDFELPRPEPIANLARRAWDAIAAGAYTVEFSLAEWEKRLVPLQICLCDVWHDHILYQGDAVTGVVDYGAVKLDCVAIDLARMLGSMIPDEDERMNDALAIYSAIHPVSGDVLRLATVLDRAGSVVGLTNWLRWLYLEKRTYTESAGVVKRMGTLLKRAEIKKTTLLGPWAMRS